MRRYDPAGLPPLKIDVEKAGHSGMHDAGSGSRTIDGQVVKDLAFACKFPGPATEATPQVARSCQLLCAASKRQIAPSLQEEVGLDFAFEAAVAVVGNDECNGILISCNLEEFADDLV